MIPFQLQVTVNVSRNGNEYIVIRFKGPTVDRQYARVYTNKCSDGNRAGVWLSDRYNRNLLDYWDDDIDAYSFTWAGGW